MQPTTSNSITRRAFLVSGAAAVATASAGVRTDATNNDLRIGLLGPGRYGSALLGELDALGPSYGAEVVAVHRDSLSAIRRAGLDGVMIATPDHLHAETAVRALESGLHVFCAAPMAITAHDAARVQSAAHESGCVYQLGCDPGLEPRWQAARALVRSGVIGDVRWCSASTSEPASTDRGWMTDPGCTLGPAPRAVHALWLASAFVTGATSPFSVSAMGGAHASGSALPDGLCVSAEFPGKLHFNLDCNPARRIAGSMTLRGSSGSLVVESDRIYGMAESLGGAELHEVWRNDGTAGETPLGAWLRAVRSDKPHNASTESACDAASGIARAVSAYHQHAAGNSALV